MMELLQTLRKIRACEGDASAQLLLEKFVMHEVAAERKKSIDAIKEHLAGTVMSKYASMAECEAARSALRNAMLDVWGG